METYKGKVCAKHPELGGERYRTGRHCVECHRERARAANMTPEHLERKRERNRKWWANRTPEQLERKRERKRERDREQRRANMTPEQRLDRLEYMRAYRLGKSIGNW